MGFEIGDVYLITGSSEFEGCAVVVEAQFGCEIYDGTGVTFIELPNCVHPLCPRTPKKAAQLARCSDGLIVYGLVDEDTAFPGAAYVLSGTCFEFIEFAGPGGEYFGSPLFDDCDSCRIIPTPTPTIELPTPTPTPTIGPCEVDIYCFSTTLPTLSGYSGTYIFAGIYNNTSYYVGDGTNTGVIYFDGEKWCLADGDTPGATPCLLNGSTCPESCPDIAPNDLIEGPCPTPTPFVDCTTFDFEAYFDCNIQPTPTITSVSNINLNFEQILNKKQVPTPTPTTYCDVTIDFTVSVIKKQETIDNQTVDVLEYPKTVVESGLGSGQVSFLMLDQTFECSSVKVLIDCTNNDEFYVSDGLILSGTPIDIGSIIRLNINQNERCLLYDRDDSSLSSNAIISSILEVYEDCDSCFVPTPTPTSTPTSTPTPTPTLTPTTTSAVPLTYVYRTCNVRFPSIVGQSVPVPFITTVSQSFKDSSGNCWYYVGSYTTYTPPSGVVYTTFNGNYFTSAQTTVYANCGSCTSSTSVTPTPTSTSVTPTPTPTAEPILGDSGYGISEAAACFDATTNARQFYSNCQTIIAGCIIFYPDPFTVLIGYPKIYTAGANYDLNPTNGQIIGLSLNQC